MAKSVEIEVLEKRGFASRVYQFSFDAQLDDDETIASVEQLVSIRTANNIRALTLGTPVVGAKAVQFRISGGSHNGKYLQICRVKTSEDNYLQAEGYLLVREPAGAPINHIIEPSTANVVFTELEPVVS